MTNFLWKEEREKCKVMKGTEGVEDTRAQERSGVSKAPERTRQPGGSTENDDRPLFPPSGLNYYHPAEHCLLWRRIILLSLGRPVSNALRERSCREKTRTGGWCGWERDYAEERPPCSILAVPRFIDLAKENHRITSKNQR